MKLNESKELTKRRYDKVRSKPEVLSGRWDESDRNLITGQMAVGVEVSRSMVQALTRNRRSLNPDGNRKTQAIKRQG